jgi:hypothetical protein
MKQKLLKIEGCDTAKEVLVQVMRNEDGSDFIQISAWHKYENEDYIQTLSVEYEENTPLMMERFVCDFSEVSANEFANSMTF